MIEAYLLYVDGKPRAIAMTASVEKAVEGFRTAFLGQQLPGEITAQSAWECPFEDLMRTAMIGIYGQMFAAGQAAAAAQIGRRH